MLQWFSLQWYQNYHDSTTTAFAKCHCKFRGLECTGFDLTFWSAIVKIYPFAILCWVNKNENMYQSPTTFPSQSDNVFLTVRPLLVKMLFIVIRTYWKQKWIIPAFKLIIFYCLTTFCNIKFFIYLLLGIFSSELYSSFLLIKPSAVQYKLSISFN